MDGFEILSKLGDGSYSVVYKVRRKADGNIYALKKVKLQNLSEKEKLNSKLILQVHDELIFDVAKDELDKMKQIINEVMPNAYKLKCKLDYSYAQGKDWYEAK